MGWDGVGGESDLLFTCPLHIVTHIDIDISIVRASIYS